MEEFLPSAFPLFLCCMTLHSARGSLHRHIRDGVSEQVSELNIHQSCGFESLFDSCFGPFCFLNGLHVPRSDRFDSLIVGYAYVLPTPASAAFSHFFLHDFIRSLRKNVGSCQLSGQCRLALPLRREHL